jgi:hypothetical protein
MNNEVMSYELEITVVARERITELGGIDQLASRQRA